MAIPKLCSHLIAVMKKKSYEGFDDGDLKLMSALKVDKGRAVPAATVLSYVYNMGNPLNLQLSSHGMSEGHQGFFFFF